MAPAPSWMTLTSLLLLAKECSSSGGVLPLGVILPPLGQRCIHEEVPAGTEATVELFVEKGAKLEVHLTIEGPMTKAWGNVPEANEKTVKLLDEVVTNGHEEDFDDSYLFTFQVFGKPNKASFVCFPFFWNIELFQVFNFLHTLFHNILFLLVGRR